MQSGGYYVGILVNGVAQQEFSDNVVGVPFEAEYKIELRGPGNGRRAVAYVYIDGVNVTPNGYVVPGYGSTYLERPTRGSTKNFKFASVNSYGAHEAGKDSLPEDKKGTIRVEFKPEKTKYRPVTTYSAAYPPRMKRLWDGDTPRFGAGDFTLCSARPTPRREQLSSGVTIEGSESNQRFVEIGMEVEEGPPIVITMKLMGLANTVGYSRMQENRYCSRCGSLKGNPLSYRCAACGHIDQ